MYKSSYFNEQGRAGLVAFRKYKGGVTAAGALGKSFYKGGFEPKMNRREAALILHLKYMPFHSLSHESRAKEPT